MTLLQTVLRAPLAPEVLALLEKIDSIESIFDTSYYPIKKVLHLDGFSRYERWMLVRSFNQIEKRHAYSCAMHVVIKNEMPEEPRKSGIMTRGQIISAAQQEFNKAFAARQAQNSTIHQGQYTTGYTDPHDVYRNIHQ